MSAALLRGCETRCPGCAHRELTASDSEALKMKWLHERLAPWQDRLRPLRGTSEANRWGYRDKTCLRAEWDAGLARWKLGLRVRKELRTYEVIDIPDCPVHSERVRAVVKVLVSGLPEAQEFPLIFALISGALVTLVLKVGQLPNSSVLERVAGLNWASLGVQGVFLNLNAAAGQRVLSSRGWHLLWGQRQVTVNGLTYGPDSFQQLIPELYFDALREAREFLRPESGSRVLDLYAGSGASLQQWRDAEATYLGVELSGEAVRCAEMNAGEGSCLRGKCSERLPQIEEWLAAASGELLAFANPPRLGLESEITRWLSREAPARGLTRLAYLSCSAGTLARDLSLLSDAGYRVRKLIPYDFFPQTPHVETLALLDRVEDV